MANEELMRQLSKDIERPSTPGPFLLRDNGGSWSPLTLSTVLVTFGGPNSREEADELASAMNQTYKEVSEKHAQAREERHNQTRLQREQPEKSL